MKIFRQFAAYSWILALIAALSFVQIDSSHRIQQIRAISSLAGPLIGPPAPDPASATGFELGQRGIILPPQAVDGYQWIMQTQQMFAADEPRVRSVGYDNPPAGREVHWASPFRWWLGLVAWTDHQITRLPLNLAVERAALYASPLLLALVLITVTPLIAFRFGGVAASVFALGWVSSIPLYEYFVAGYLDHHGMAVTCACLTVFGILKGGAGWVRVEHAAPAPGLTSPPAARRWFALSAIAGGAGLWISAASIAPILVAIGLGALAAGRFGKKADLPIATTRNPSVWRFWGRCGCGVSLAAYLLEYFPGHLGWRLEVNHPLYALAWLGGGELIALWWEGPGLVGLFRTAATRWATAFAAVAILLLPSVILVTKAQTFYVADPFLWRLHGEYLSEFQSMARYVAKGGINLDFVFFATFVPLLLLAPIVYTLYRRETPAPARAGLAVIFAPAALTVAMAANQIRWCGFCSAALLAVLVYGVWLQRTYNLWPRLAYRFVLMVITLSLLTASLWNAWEIKESRGAFNRAEVQQVILRDLAYWLRQRVGTQPAVIVTSPTPATPLAYHSGLAVTGTLYWENRDGLQATASLFAARSAEEAHRIVRRHNITHLVFVSWNDFSQGYTRLARGLSDRAPLPDDAFMLNLVRTKITPPWLRPVPLQLPASPALEGEAVFIFEVIEPQTFEEALVQMTFFLVDSNKPQTAARLIPALQRYPEFVPSMIALAHVHMHLKQHDGFNEAMQRVFAMKSRFADLALSDRVQLLGLLIAIGDDEESRRACEISWKQAQADEFALRKLPASAVANLLHQSRRLGVEPPPGIHQLALRLLPPRWLQDTSKP